MWNAFPCRLSLIKGEYGRNATLKRLDKHEGRGRTAAGRILQRRVTEGREGSAEPAESCSRTNLLHVLVRDGVGTPGMGRGGGESGSRQLNPSTVSGDGGQRDAGVMRRMALPLRSFSQIRVNGVEQTGHIQAC